MKLSEKILELRKGMGLSQEELAEKLNVSRQTVSRWEVGSALPDAENLRLLSGLFGVTADYLLNDDYASDGDVPRVKKAETVLRETEHTLRRRSLLVSLIFAVAGLVFLIITIDTLNIRYIFPALVCASAAGFFLWRHSWGRGNDGGEK